MSLLPVYVSMLAWIVIGFLLVFGPKTPAPGKEKEPCEL